YNYLNKILKNWEELKLDTPEKVKNHLVGKYSKKTQKQAKGRVEQLPDHIANPKTEADASALARQKLIDLGVTPND
ncbi:DnaD domain protein, partial [Enterococcus gilvus]